MSKESTPHNSVQPNHSERPPVALIAGPTASGKSELALHLAEQVASTGQNAVNNAAIVNADSAQVYADLPILSAAPSPEELARADHVLYGAWDGASPCNAADWAKAAIAQIDALHAQGTMPILVGGTGLYIRTLLDGIAPIPPIDPDIRAATRALPLDEAYRFLEQEDPASAARLHPSDTTRITRALEVVRSTGHPLAHWHAHMEGGIADRIDLRAAITMPEREWLYDRCNRRFIWMLDNGAVEEVQALLAREIDQALPVMRAIGVREISGWLKGDVSRDEAIKAGQQATRNYAKRQYTWFSRQTPDDWHRIKQINDNDISNLVRILL